MYMSTCHVRISLNPSSYPTENTRIRPDSSSTCFQTPILMDREACSLLAQSLHSRLNPPRVLWALLDPFILVGVIFLCDQSASLQDHHSQLGQFHSHPPPRALHSPITTVRPTYFNKSLPVARTCMRNKKN